MLSPTNLYSYSQLSRGINLQARSIAHSSPTDPIIRQTMKLVTLQTPNSIDPQLDMKAKQRRPQHVITSVSSKAELVRTTQKKAKQSKATNDCLPRSLLSAVAGPIA